MLWRLDRHWYRLAAGKIYTSLAYPNVQYCIFYIYIGWARILPSEPYLVYQLSISFPSFTVGWTFSLTKLGVRISDEDELDVYTHFDTGL